MEVARTLIVEADPELASQLEFVLGNYGFDTETVTTGEAALVRVGAVDLVVLDPFLPDGDGLELCGRLAAKASLVMVSDRADEADRVAALELGADDYLTRPYGGRELVARCRAILRRRRAAFRTGWGDNPMVVGVGELDVDLDRHEARCGGVPLPLTSKELGAAHGPGPPGPGTWCRRAELRRRGVGCEPGVGHPLARRPHVGIAPQTRGGGGALGPGADRPRPRLPSVDGARTSHGRRGWPADDSVEGDDAADVACRRACRRSPR